MGDEDTILFLLNEPFINIRAILRKENKYEIHNEFCWIIASFFLKH